MRTLKLLVAYDGTDFVGWQRQPGGVSIQGMLEGAFAPLAGRVTVIGAGRTDAGVHATGQVASVRVESALPSRQIRSALNARLPAAVRVLDVEEVEASFHARFDARTKTYEYRILHGPLVSPFGWRYAWHLTGELDDAAMARAAGLIEGEHDFACFQSSGSSVRTSVRTVYRSWLSLHTPAFAESVVPEPSSTASRLLIYRITGGGFLRHMVRAIVGTLVEVGRRARTPDEIAMLLSGGARGAAGPTAPAHGLCLAGVDYGELRLSGKTL